MNKDCGCKGIRTCLICETLQDFKSRSQDQQKIKRYQFCDQCGEAWTEDGQAVLNHPHHLGEKADVIFTGVHIIHDFVTAEEEENLAVEIDKTNWMESQSGRRKQDYGPKVNFKKKKVKMSVFTGLPDFSERLVHKLRSVECLKEFIPVELCNLDYDPSRGSAIDPHFDDFWLWGENLVTLNLLSDTHLTFTTDEKDDIEIAVLMPRRSLIVVYGAARYEWKHAIHRLDITSRRLAMTFRELTPEFLPGGQRDDVGREIIQLAMSFNGIAVGV